MKAERGEDAEEEKFEASRCRFIRFKESSPVQNIKLQDEATSVDVEAALRYPEDVAKIITLKVISKLFQSYFKSYFKVSS